MPDVSAGNVAKNPPYANASKENNITSKYPFANIRPKHDMKERANSIIKVSFLPIKSDTLAEIKRPNAFDKEDAITPIKRTEISMPRCAPIIIRRGLININAVAPHIREAINI
jgi:hypothetical protein